MHVLYNESWFHFFRIPRASRRLFFLVVGSLTCPPCEPCDLGGNNRRRHVGLAACGSFSHRFMRLPCGENNMWAGPASHASDECTDASRFFHCPHMWIFPVPPFFLFITFPHECSVAFTAKRRHRFCFPLVPFLPACVEGCRSQVVFPDPRHHQEP
jgi:hypothetical protein